MRASRPVRYAPTWTPARSCTWSAFSGTPATPTAGTPGPSTCWTSSWTACAAGQAPARDRRRLAPGLRGSATPAEDHDGGCVSQAPDRAEPVIRAAAVPAGDLDQPAHDHGSDHHQPGDGRRPQVDLGEALVPAVTPKAADRLAAAGQQDEQAEAGHESELSQALAGVAAQSARREYHDAEGDAEWRHEPPR